MTILLLGCVLNITHDQTSESKVKSCLAFLSITLSCSALKEDLLFILQSNLNSSNTNGPFTMANSNSFLSPYEILPLAQENKYLGKFSYFIM